MSNSPSSPLSRSFQQSLLQKQQEITQLNLYQVKTLQQAIIDKEQEVLDAQKRYKQLRDDFEYNLKLLEGRDEELKRYDKTFLQLKREILERDKVDSELKMQLKESQERHKAEQQRANDIEIYYQEQLQALKQEYETRELAQKKERTKLEMDYENLVKEVRAQFEQQLQDVKLQSQDALHERELTMQEMRSTINRLETQVENLKAEQKSAENLNFNTQQEKETKIKLLNDQIASQQETIESLKANHQKQLESLKSVNVHHSEEINKTYEKRIATLKAQLDESQRDVERFQAKVKQVQYESEDKLRSLQSDYDELKKQMDESISLKDIKIEDLNNRLWETEVSLGNYEKKCTEAQKNLNERKQDVEFLKRELAKASEREQLLKRDLLQDQFKVEQEVEQRERELAKRNDDLLKATMRDRDDALAQLTSKQQQIEQLQKQLRETQRGTSQSQQHYGGGRGPQTTGSTAQRIGDAIDRELDLGSLRAPSPLPSVLGDDDEHRYDDAPQHNFQNYLGPDKSKAHLVKENEELRKRNSELHEQNMQIREGLEEMRREIEGTSNHMQVQQLHRELDHLNGELNKANAKLIKKQDRIDELEHRIEEQEEKLRNSGSAQKMEEMLQQLKREFEKKNVSHLESSEQVTHLNSQLTELRVEYERQKDKYIRVFEIAQKLKKENKHLRAKLKAAAKDMKHVLSDREKLIDINNMYKAELKNLAPKGHIKVFERGASSPVEGKGRYEEEIAKLRNDRARLATSKRILEEKNEQLMSNLRQHVPEQLLNQEWETDRDAHDDLELEGNPMQLHDRPRTAHISDRETVSQKKKRLHQMLQGTRK